MEPVKLSVATWNVLADSYVRPDWFPRADPDVLLPGARTADVVRLAAGLGVDVLALQEVEPAVAGALAAGLPGHDVRWCPKGRGRPDGCVTAVRFGWDVVQEERHVYPDGDPVSGHVAHVLMLERAGVRVRVANTHARFDTAAAPEHIGVRQVRWLLGSLPEADVTVLAADLNDVPGGPVRAEIERADLVAVHGGQPSSLFAGAEPRALDVVAVRGANARVVPTGVPVSDALPSRACPSDHVPLVARVLLEGSGR